MRRDDFRAHYQAIFAGFGYPLSARQALPERAIQAAEKRLGVLVPKALRDYYLVAGRESRFNSCFNALRSPEGWELSQGRLVFMDDHQGAVCWGASVRAAAAADPTVWQGVGDESEMEWHLEHRKCSVFLTVMLHYQAVNDGLPFGGQVAAPDAVKALLKRGNWRYRGEVNSLRAYACQNQVVCLLPPDGSFHDDKGSVLAGGKTEADLKAIGYELGVTIPHIP